jgi:protein-tyrosine phosphatase
VKIAGAEYRKTDFHSHILPQIDDGSKNTEESISMLSILRNDGVETVYATPHFYPQYETVKEFLRRRHDSWDKLKKALSETVQPETFPDVKIGAEVYFVPSKIKADMKELPELCIEGTDFLLFELPYENYGKTLVNAVSSFITGCKHTVVLAHIERYTDVMSEPHLNEILQNEVLAQINCTSVIENGYREMKLIRRLSHDRIARFLGTDAHGAVRRPPEYAKALKILGKKIPDFFGE